MAGSMATGRCGARDVAKSSFTERGGICTAWCETVKPQSSPPHFLPQDHNSFSKSTTP